MDEQERELLLAEYRSGHEGYRSRDDTIPREFSWLLQTFVLSLALVAGAKAFMTLNPAFTYLVMFVIGIAGFLAMLAFAADIQANTSCKNALRDRGEEIERQLSSPSFRHWAVIRERKKFRIERLLKEILAPSPRASEGSIATIFVRASEVLLGLWIVVFLVVFFSGYSIDLPTGS